MRKIVYTADFAALRKAYAEVKTFMEAEAWDDETVTLKTAIAEDLGMYGDDNLELLVKFAGKYNLDIESFDYSKHFLYEGELFNGKAFNLSVLLIPIWIIEKLSLGLIKIYPHKLFEGFYRPTTDCTMRQMLSWYLTKTYIPAEELSIKLAYQAV